MTEVVKLNRRQQAKIATRAKLLETARRVWAEPGTYEAATMRVIAAAAGMSTGAIFANWPGKEDLWREAMGYEPPVDGPQVRMLLEQMAQMKRAA